MNTKAITSSAVALLLASACDAAVLDFAGLPGNSILSQTYGDTANVNVSYSILTGFGSSPVTSDPNYSMRTWIDGYGNLIDVAWGGGAADTDFAGNIELAAAPGFTVTLSSFDLAGFIWDQPDRSARVYDGSFNLLAEFGPTTISGTGHSSFNPAVTASVLHLQWDYPWGVGIDNVNFTAGAITQQPVPDGGSTIGLLVGSMFSLLTVRRLTRRTS